MSLSSEGAMKAFYPLHPSVKQKLDPAYVKYYETYLLNATPSHYQPVEISRIKGVVSPGCSETLPVGHVEDFYIHRLESSGPDVRIRCFTPPSTRPESGWPIMIYYHGGGFVLGDIDSENNVATNICIRSQCIVICVEYRLAPEHPYPAAVHDCWEVLLWLINNATPLKLDLRKVAIGGASAGACLAAVTVQKSSSRPDILAQMDIRIQLLVVPVTDQTSNVDNNPSWRLYEHTASLSAEKMLWYRHQYLPDPAIAKASDASPLFFQGDFGQLPPAVVLVGELDILREEGRLYAEKLRSAGVHTHLEVMSGMPHTFVALDAILSEGRRAISILCDAIADAFR